MRIARILIVLSRQEMRIAGVLIVVSRQGMRIAGRLALIPAPLSQFLMISVETRGPVAFRKSFCDVIALTKLDHNKRSWSWVVTSHDHHHVCSAFRWAWTWFKILATKHLDTRLPILFPFSFYLWSYLMPTFNQNLHEVHIGVKVGLHLLSAHLFFVCLTFLEKIKPVLSYRST